MFWNPILSKITPSFLERCEWAVRDANEFLERTLRENMLSQLGGATQDAAIAALSRVFTNNEGRAHNTHIQFQQCVDSGLKVSRLEDAQKLQDLVLTIHHFYMHTLGNTGAFKIVENHLGRAMVKTQQLAFMHAPAAVGAAPVVWRV